MYKHAKGYRSKRGPIASKVKGDKTSKRIFASQKKGLAQATFEKWKAERERPKS
jgi:hypothetical protein